MDRTSALRVSRGHFVAWKNTPTNVSGGGRLVGNRARGSGGSWQRNLVARERGCPELERRRASCLRNRGGRRTRRTGGTRGSLVLSRQGTSPALCPDGSTIGGGPVDTRPCSAVSRAVGARTSL